MNFSSLIKSINDGTIEPWLRDHCFAFKNQMAEALQKDKRWQVKGPDGKVIYIEWDDNERPN